MVSKGPRNSKASDHGCRTLLRAEGSGPFSKLLEMSWLPGKAGGPGPNPKSSFPNGEDCTLSTPSSLVALQTPQPIQPERHQDAKGTLDGRRVASLSPLREGLKDGVVVGKLASPQ